MPQLKTPLSKSESIIKSDRYLAINFICVPLSTT